MPSQVDQIMSEVVQVPTEQRVLDTIKFMIETKEDAVLVHDQQNQIVGIFTEKDFFRKVDWARPESVNQMSVGQLMTKELKTVNEIDNPLSILILMLKNNIRHAPVLKDGKISGMIHLKSIMLHNERMLRDKIDERTIELGENIKRLRDSEKMLRTVFENSAVAITLADQEEKIIAWNPFASKLLGMDEKDLLYKPVKDLYTSEEWDKVRTCNIRKWGQKQHLETKVINKNGEQIDVDMAITVLKDVNGKITGSIGIMSDIRTRKNLTNMLNSSVKELEDLKSGLDEHAIVTVLNKDGKITYANDKFCAVSKYSREELIGQDYRAFNSVQPIEFMQSLWETISQGKIWKGEIKNVTKEGDYYWVETTIVPIRNAEDQSYQYIVINTDMTQRKKQEEEIKLMNRDLAANAKALREMVVDKENAYRKLAESQQQIIQIEKMATLGTLAAGFAHEIKNPLAIILQGIERVEKAAAAQPDNPSQQYIQIVKSAALRSNKLVTSILRYSRASQVEAQHLNLYHVIESAVDLVQETANQHGVKITTQFNKDHNLPISGDNVMLQQVFFDLMMNAIDAMAEGGKIDIRTRFVPNKDNDQKGAYIIDVADNGEGIEQQFLTKIFDPFFTTKEEGKGTGLGLSTVFLILERHNGTISVKSKRGEGATFTITLPVDGVPLNTKEEKDGREN